MAADKPITIHRELAGRDLEIVARVSPLVAMFQPAEPGIWIEDDRDDSGVLMNVDQWRDFGRATDAR